MAASRYCGGEPGGPRSSPDWRRWPDRQWTLFSAGDVQGPWRRVGGGGSFGVRRVD
ncbi:MAG: hypothetical protein ACRDSR_15105 [Pseudonocardiaceae bacterium]